MIDLRTPIGLLFVILGVALVAYGLSSEPAIYEASLGINVNLWWGIVMGMFGVSMLAGAVLARTPPPGRPPDSNDLAGGGPR